eukprot:TRINITY_DN82385_c0_g1_i1.p1 TRINITY_DN82385_c0_g1~~TRINITY_DN82385_c0_g1_i1.p1  ORF type:complete len:346 (+),score=77.14 TRINITY_DN82385_c0_g1_i1:93-1040(+)
MEIADTEYRGWKAVSLKTSCVELVVTQSIGPRCISARVRGGENLFAEKPEEIGFSGEDKWMIRGGHRFWHAPEDPSRTYQPDNEEISIERLPKDLGIIATSPTEPATFMQKTVKVEMIRDNTFRVTHVLRNDGVWSVKCSAWAISVLRKDGFAVLPLMPKRSHQEALIPSYSIVPWQYTDFSHPAWVFRKEFIGIDTTVADVPQKIGLSHSPGWMAYWQDQGTFVKYAPLNAKISRERTKMEYPDLGCSAETFFCDWMLELETLSPMDELAPGKEIRHVEYWGFLKELARPDNEREYHTSFLPAVEEWISRIEDP